MTRFVVQPDHPLTVEERIALDEAIRAFWESPQTYIAIPPGIEVTFHPPDAESAVIVCALCAWARQWAVPAVDKLPFGLWPTEKWVRRIDRLTAPVSPRVVCPYCLDGRVAGHHECRACRGSGYQ